MGYQEDWEEIQADPKWGTLPEQTKKDLARFYARKVVRPQVKQGDPGFKDFLSKNVLQAPSGQSARTRDHLLPSLGENLTSELQGNLAAGAVGAARFLADEGPVGTVRRVTQKAVDKTLDATVGKALGLPSSEEVRRKTGLPENHRMLPYVAPEQRHPGEMGGALAAGFVDPINVAAPLNAFARSAPALKTGVNLLPKAAPKAALAEAVKAALGAGATNATIAGATSALGQVADRRSLGESTTLSLPVAGNVTAPKVAVDAALGGVFGAGLAGLGVGANISAINRATQRGVNRSLSHAAEGRGAGAITGGTVSAQDIQGLEAARQMAHVEPGLASDIPHPAVDAITARHTPADIEGFMRAERAAADFIPPDVDHTAASISMTGHQSPKPLPVKPEAPTPKPLPEMAPLQIPEDLQANIARLKALNDEAAATPLGARHPEAPAPVAPEPAGGSTGMRRLLSDESGSATVEGALVLPQVQAARDLAVKGAEKGAEGYTAVTEGLTRLGNAALEKVKVKGVSGRQVLDKLEQYRQAVKHAPAGALGDELRSYFVSNFGVSPKVLALADDASRAAHRAATPMRRQAHALLKELDSHQQKNLELAITEPTLRGKMITEIAKATGKQPMVVADLVRSIVDDSTRMTTLLKEVGAVSESGSARWEGQYLPRTYEKLFPTISRYVKGTNTLKGKQGRGIEKTVAKSSVPEMQAQGWEFRGEQGGKARMWRDYTLDERFKMDQVFHASQAMGKMASEFERDFRNGKLLADIAKSSDEKGAFAIPASEVKGDPPTGYTLFSNANTKGTGIKRWGALADHYVREDVAHYLTWASDNSAVLETLRNIKTWTGTNLFKRFKTIWNPAHYVNNFMQNVPMLELAGGSAGDLPKAFREAVTEGELFKKLEEFGTVKNGAVSRDLATHLEAIQVEDLTPISAMKKALGALKNVEAVGSDIAQATDDLFKVAFVQRKMAEGMEFEAAARAAEDVFYEASKVTAPAAQVMEAFGFPFARVLWYQADKLPELLIKNPAKAAVLMSYFAVTKALVDKWNGTTDKQVQAREELIPDHMKKPLGTGFMPLPAKDSKGNQLVLNTGNWSPLGILDNADQVQAPFFPSALMPGGVAPTLYQALNNRDMFRGKDLRTPAGDDTGRFLMENLAPGVISKAGTLADALAGRESYSGLPYDAPTAALGMLGIKAQPYSPALGIKHKGQDFDAKKSGIEGQIRYLQTMAARNPQDAAKYEWQIKALIDKLTAEGQAFGKQMETAAGAF
jgi:hypothetical protein